MSNSGGEEPSPEAPGIEGTLLPKPGDSIHPIFDHRREQWSFRERQEYIWHNRNIIVKW
jgi:hypothetical protein